MSTPSPQHPAPQTIWYGGDYNPDQWSRETWLDDVRLMRDAGVNTVTIGVFAWSSLEPREGEYDFAWLDDVMDLMHSHDIGVILATPTASPPPWFTEAHPQGLPVTEDGVRLIHGSRDTYNPASLSYRQAAQRITTAMAQRYGTHPALRMWHLHNEYGTVSFGPETDAAFRTWLRAKYGTLEALNHTWNARFWSQQYSTWEQIHAPQKTQYLHNPTHVLDFKKFSADQLRNCLNDQIAIMRDVTPHIALTTNFMLPTWNHYNQWDFAADIDVVSIDHYLDSTDLRGEAHVAFAAELTRSFADGKPWMVMEQATTVIYDYAAGRMYPKAPGRMARNTLQYIAHGSNSSLFFQWRAPLTGAEFFHSGMIPHSGENTRTWREISDLGATLQRLEGVTTPPEGRTHDARIAIVWDPTAWWAAQTPAMPSGEFDFYRDVRDVHEALWMEGYHAEFTSLDRDLSGYDLIVVPNQIAVSDDQAARLTTYVEGGGTAALWFFTGSTDENMRVRTGSYSAAFAHIIGAHIAEPWPLTPHTTVELANGATGHSWSEDLTATTASVVTTYAQGPLAGQPALLRNNHGTGTVWYLTTRLIGDDLRTYVRDLATGVGINKSHPQAGNGLEIVRRHSANGSYLFAMNHTATPQAVHATGTDIVTGRTITGNLDLPAYGYAVIKEDRS